MPTTNVFFNNFNATGEQNLLHDLIIESIKIYGHEVYYMPRSIVAQSNVFGEDLLSKFEDAHPIEMYIKNVEGFEGEGDFLSKFNLEIRDSITFTVSQRRWQEEIDAEDTHLDSDGNRIARPAEGDLLYFPLNGKMFEVKFVEHEAVFYQMGSLQTYDLRCELFDYSHESIDTGIGVIDAIEDDLSSNALNFQILDEAGNIFILEDGSSLVQEGYRLENTDNTANNEFFGASTNIDFMDFSEGNPFSEGNN
jgi:hypothetical protein|tara:strand:- start:672 stop:1424 length:753 start_codon:yes stop_codon:yes gene_type:complete